MIAGTFSLPYAPQTLYPLFRNTLGFLIHVFGAGRKSTIVSHVIRSSVADQKTAHHTRMPLLAVRAERTTAAWLARSAGSVVTAKV